MRCLDMSDYTRSIVSGALTGIGLLLLVQVVGRVLLWLMG